MYLTKVLDATEGNLMLIDLPANPNERIRTGSQSNYKKNKSFELNIYVYIALAESFRMTNNYLCSINTLLKWQFYFFSTHANEQPHASLEGNYQTLQSK
jgi:hypothetical protein